MRNTLLLAAFAGALSLLFSCDPSNQPSSVDGLEGEWGLVKTESSATGEEASPDKKVRFYDPSDPTDGYIKMIVEKDGKRYNVTRYIWAQHSSEYEIRHEMKWTVKGNRIILDTKEEATFTLSGNSLVIETVTEVELLGIISGSSGKVTMVDRYEFVRMNG